MSNNDKNNYAKSKSADLFEIRDLLKGELDKFNAINNEVVDNQSDFSKIHNNYDKYNDQMDVGGQHITELKKREFFENLFVYIGFYFFLGCVAYVLLKRFPLHKIIAFVIRTFFKIINYFIKIFRKNSAKTNEL